MLEPRRSAPGRPALPTSCRTASFLTASLPFTGERFTPEIRGAIWYEHWHRYCAVLPAAKGRRVLDVACGEGYGSMLLAGVAAEVTGVDVDAAAIGHAVARYGERANLRYVQGSCTALPLAEASVDLVVSFETIEHLSGQEAMLAEFRRVLTPGGVLVISSPNKPVYSDETGLVNAFHVRELTREELSAMLGAHFPRQAWYGQRVLAHSLLWAERRDGPRAAELVALDGDNARLLDVPAPAMYFVVVCGAEDAALPELPALSVFDDGAQSLYRDYERALLAEKRLYWDEVDARKVAEERLAQLIGAVNDLASSRQREAAIGARVEALEAELSRTQRSFTQTSGALAHAKMRLADVDAKLAYRESWIGWLRWPLSRLRQRFAGAR